MLHYVAEFGPQRRWKASGYWGYLLGKSLNEGIYELSMKGSQEALERGSSF